VVTRASVAPQVLGSTPCGSEFDLKIYDIWRDIRGLKEDIKAKGLVATGRERGFSPGWRGYRSLKSNRD
jgi:hypothetical protein